MPETSSFQVEAAPWPSQASDDQRPVILGQPYRWMTDLEPQHPCDSGVSAARPGLEEAVE